MLLKKMNQGQQLLELIQKPASIKVTDLCKLKIDFIIPYYQRGYRWTTKEVERLIKDIIDYRKERDGRFYCLQPLVIRDKQVGDKHIWRVIDGQQRLTTIFLLLNYLGTPLDMYSLEYERDNILKKIIDSGQDFDPDENCEIYHLSNALKAINDYFTALPDDKAEIAKNTLRTNLLDNCSFILYAMKSEGIEDEHLLDLMEHDLFNNLNSGKISLTESELIKALLLHNIGETKTVKEVKQISMAEELDRMERTLREDEMWYFLAGDRPKPSSCIDYLYRVWYIAEFVSIPDDIDYPIFSSLENISSDSLILSNWENIRKCFYIITGWYTNPLLYNLIGYLEGRKTTKNQSEKTPPYNEYLLAQLYHFAVYGNDKKKIPNKEEFIMYIKQLCRDTIPANFLEAQFDKDKNMVFNILLLMNIAMLINNKKQDESGLNAKSTGKGENVPISKFPFHVFHKLNWNVEHISPQNPKDKFKLYSDLCDLKDEYRGKLPYEVAALFKKLDDNKDNLDSLNNDAEYLSMIRELIPDGEQAMLLQNLTLLTEHDNKGIGNKFYFDKRNKLNEYQSNGSFIPAATINVFSKWYTDNPDGFVLWGEKDQQAYLEAIYKTITDFINSNE